MISRAYVVTMPSSEEGGSNPVDILVQDDPGSPAAPVSPSGGGQYWEVRGRPIRFETLAADGATGGFVPLANLGLVVSVVQLGSAAPALIPSVQLSESISTIASDLGTPFADPDGQPAIRLTGSGSTEGVAFLVTVQIAQAQDEDRQPRQIG